MSVFLDKAIVKARSIHPIQSRPDFFRQFLFAKGFVKHMGRAGPDIIICQFCIAGYEQDFYPRPARPDYIRQFTTVHSFRHTYIGEKEIEMLSGFQDSQGRRC